MKRLTALFVTLLLVVGTFARAEIDIDSLTEAEIAQLIERGIYRIAALNETSERTIIYENGGIRISMDRYAFYEEYWDGTGYFVFSLLVENESEYKVFTRCSHAALNGWTVDPGYSGELNTQPFSRNRANEFYIKAESEAGVTALEQMKTLTLEIELIWYSSPVQRLEAGPVRLAYSNESGFVSLP